LLERFPRSVVALVAGLAVVTAVAATQLPAQAAPPAPTEASIVTSAPATKAAAQYDSRRPLKFERWATMAKTSYGYYYDAGQQDTHLVITRVKGGVRFADTHTDVLRSKAKACDRKPARVGIVLVCRVPKTVDKRHPMTLRVFTRLGNDRIDSSALSAEFELYMLCDAGRETVKTGAGNDFINGAQNNDRIWGGGGADWIRTGKGDDQIWGGPGRDRLAGVYGRDEIHGGDGNDRVGGGSGNDRLVAGDGTDFVICGTGTDNANAQRTDRILADCESVAYK
jgi:serralysin